MKSQILTKEQTELDITNECSNFGLRIGTAVCAIIGFWAFACLLSALVSAGPMNMVRGYITAITGM